MLLVSEVEFSHYPIPLLKTIREIKDTKYQVILEGLLQDYLNVSYKIETGMDADVLIQLFRGKLH